MKRPAITTALTGTDTSTVSALRDPLEHVLGYQLRRAALATIAALSAAMETLDLTLTEAITIRFVDANPGCNQAEVGRALGVKRTNMVPIIAGLVSAGLVTRRPADGRTHALHLTVAGAKRHREIQAVAQAHEQRFFGELDEEQRLALIKVCQIIRAKA